jgi:A/G-specific adenine glycosylase
LDLRKRGPATEVLLEHRPDDAPLMPAMYELPPLALDTVDGLEPALRLRHAITNTNYYVQVFSPRLMRTGTGVGKRMATSSQTMRSAIATDNQNLHWVRTTRLASLPLTGLTRKILQRLKVMQNSRIEFPEWDGDHPVEDKL